MITDELGIDLEQFDPLDRDVIILIVNMVSFYVFLKLNQKLAEPALARLRELCADNKLPESLVSVAESLNTFYVSMDIADAEIMGSPGTNPFSKMTSH